MEMKYVKYGEESEQEEIKIKSIFSRARGSSED